MVEKVGGKLGTVTYLQGPFDVIADVEVDNYETASGLHATMMLSGGWDELLILPEMDVDKAQVQQNCWGLSDARAGITKSHIIFTVKLDDGTWTTQHLRSSSVVSVQQRPPSTTER